MMYLNREMFNKINKFVEQGYTVWVADKGLYIAKPNTQDLQLAVSSNLMIIIEEDK